MNKLVCGILTVILCLSAVGALAQESDLPEVRWTYPVSLTEIQSKYAMLVNADNMLEKDFEPDPLVKVTGVKRATSLPSTWKKRRPRRSRKCSTPPRP